MKAPVPNIQEILKQNPDIARQMAAQAMQNQTQQFRSQAQQQNVQVPMYSSPPAPAPAPAPPAANPLAGLMSFLGGTTQPPPPQSRVAAAAPVREMKPPSGMGIGDILKSIQKEEKKIVAKPSSAAPAAPAAPPLGLPKPALKKSSGGGSVVSATSGTSRKSPKNSVVIKL